MREEEQGEGGTQRDWRGSLSVSVSVKISISMLVCSTQMFLLVWREAKDSWKFELGLSINDDFNFF